MHSIRWKAVALGTAVKLVLGTLFFLLFGFVMGFVVANAGGRPERLLGDPRFWVGGLVLCVCASIFGGFVAGRLAPDHVIRHGILVGLVSILIGGFMGLIGPRWFQVSAIALLLPASALGAVLGQRSKKEPPPKEDQYLTTFKLS